MEVETATGVSGCKFHPLFYLAIHKLDVETILQSKKVLVHTYAGRGEGYIGLCTTQEGAMERARHVFSGNADVNMDTFRMLVIRFSGAGVAKYVRKIQDDGHQYCSTFYKITYPWDTSGKDHGCWAFVGDMPIEEIDDRGVTLISSQVLLRESQILCAQK